MKKPTHPIKGETFIHAIFRYLSFLLVTKVLWNTKITPNQITLFRTVLFVVSFYLFLYGDWRYMIGFLIFQIAELLDSTDGDIARYKDMKSRLGIWMEVFFDAMLTPVWGMLGLLFAYLSYRLDGSFVYFVLWGLIGLSTNLEKTFYIHFGGTKQKFEDAEHDIVYFGFIGMDWKTKLKHFIIVSKVWENQWLIFSGLLYVLFGINLYLYIWIWILMLNQLHWIRLAYTGYQNAKV